MSDKNPQEKINPHEKSSSKTFKEKISRCRKVTTAYLEIFLLSK